MPGPEPSDPGQTEGETVRSRTLVVSSRRARKVHAGCLSGRRCPGMTAGVVDEEKKSQPRSMFLPLWVPQGGEVGSPGAVCLLLR